MRWPWKWIRTLFAASVSYKCFASKAFGAYVERGWKCGEEGRLPCKDCDLWQACSYAAQKRENWNCDILTYRSHKTHQIFFFITELFDENILADCSGLKWKNLIFFCETKSDWFFYWFFHVKKTKKNQSLLVSKKTNDFFGMILGNHFWRFRRNPMSFPTYFLGGGTRSNGASFHQSSKIPYAFWLNLALFLERFWENRLWRFRWRLISFSRKFSLLNRYFCTTLLYQFFFGPDEMEHHIINPT